MPKVNMNIVDQLIEEELEDDGFYQSIEEMEAQEEAEYQHMLYQEHLEDLAREEEEERRERQYYDDISFYDPYEDSLYAY